MLKIICVTVLCASLLSSCGRSGSAPMETNTPVPDANNTAKQENLIGEEKAKEIALQKAGLSHGEVVFDRVELEKDAGVWHYEVEFKKGSNEYDAHINATDGTVMSWETHTND